MKSYLTKKQKSESYVFISDLLILIFLSFFFLTTYVLSVVKWEKQE